jgi:hypothetical protein
VIAVPTISRYTVNSNHFILLFSDGLHLLGSEAVTNDHLARIVMCGLIDKKSSPEILQGMFAQRLDHSTPFLTIVNYNLTNNSLFKGADDNLSAVLILLRDHCDSTIETCVVTRFQPGSFSQPNNANFVAAYRANCEHYGKTLEQVLEELGESQILPATQPSSPENTQPTD